MAKWLGTLVAIVQFVLHYLGIIAILLGIVAFIFGNTGRGKELLIGGIGWLALKYLIGAAYVLGLKIAQRATSPSD